MTGLVKDIIEVFTQNPLTVTLAVFGVLFVGIAIIGRVPPIDLTGGRSLALGSFGGVLIVTSIGLSYLLVTAAPPQSGDQLSATPITPFPSAIPSYVPTLTSTTTTAPTESLTPQPVITAPPQADCNQGAYMPPVPKAPPPGCVLTVEWWYPPNPTPCGLWITYGDVLFDEGVAGYWWYEYDVSVPAHIEAFKAKATSANCEVKDFR